MSQNPNSSATPSEEWFSQEMGLIFKGFVTELSVIMDDVESQIEAAARAGWDESYVERVIRDIKAAGYNTVIRLVLDTII